MNIDVKELAKESVADIGKLQLAMMMGSEKELLAIFEASWERSIRCVRAVIADEREAAKAPPQPESGAEVPEWCETLAAHIYEPTESLGDCGNRVCEEGVAKSIHAAAESELTRRVAEAAAAKDKRDPDEELHAECHQLICSGDRRKPVGHPGCVCRDGIGKVNRANGELRQQLAASQAELTKLRDENARMTNEIIGNLKVIPGAIRVREGGADEDVAKSLAVSVAKLVEENARLTRPVDDVEVVEHVGRVFGTVTRVVRESDLQAERNAREAAEAELRSYKELYAAQLDATHQSDITSDEANQRAVAAERERDELREAWKFCYACESIKGDGKYFASIRGKDGGPCGSGLFDDPNGAVLAAFRAEKAKVQQ